ncbi:MULTISPECIES: MgtC/SapB family protein [unclassified Paenibacillus]|uniref:MgtC/SapB family protein n=1 Tax=unclassified Paenibacillus TaxID=185978 RepID=UPI000930BA36|nr:MULTISPECIES: MgtC/SapB family protein [unclassified Paenibacillus]
MLLAAGLGGLIGLEREWSNHAAGFRTHILVCIGSAAIMLLSIYGFSEFANEYNVRMDPARLAAQVISGIGFLGAGAILRTGSTVSGLTTAASIWVVAAIGLCVGAGFYYGAALATVLVLLSLFVLNKWERYLMRHRRNHEIVILIYDRPGVLGKIATMFGEQSVQIVNVKMKPDDSQDKDKPPVMELRFSVKSSHSSDMMKAIENISLSGEIISLDTGSFKLSKSLSTHNAAL